MRRLRRLVYPLWLARTRLAARRGRTALVGLGIAGGALALALVSAASLIAQDTSLERALSKLPLRERSVQALWFGVPRATPWRSLDTVVRPVLRGVARDSPSAFVRYRQTRVGGALVDLAAGEDVARWIRVRSGRAPRACRPNRCEVVRVAGSGRVPRVPGLRLVAVGEGTLVPGAPLGTSVSRERERSVVGTALRYHTPKSPPFLVAEGVEELARAPALSLVYRSYGWVVPLEPGTLEPWEVEPLAAELARARSTLDASAESFDLVAPLDFVTAAHESGEAAARRLLLLGGEAAALLLAFALLAATAARRDADAAWRRLIWAGARKWQLLLLTAVESGAVAVLAAVAGWVLGGALAAVGAEAAGVSPRGVLAHSVLSPRGLATAALLAAAGAAVLVVSLVVRPLRLGGRTLSPLDVAAAAAVVAIALALVRGELDARALAAEGGTGAVLILLPALVAFVGAVASARALAPAVRLLDRVARVGPLSARLAALSLARNPGRAATVAAFLVVSFGLALFAAVYRSTLAEGQQAQAEFAVPADFVVRESLSNLVPVLDAAPLSRYRSFAPGAEAHEVVRLSGSVTREARGFTLLGISASALHAIGGWRDDYSRLSLAQLARQIAPAGAVRLRAVPLPPDAEELRVAVAIEGEDMTVAANVRTPRADFAAVDLGRTRGSRRIELRARLPREARGGSLVGLTFGFARSLHREPGGGVNVQEPTAAGNLALGPVRAVGPSGARALPVDYSRWLGIDGARLVRADGGGARLALIVTNEFPARFRPRQPTDGAPVPAVVSPGLAAAAGRDAVLPLGFTGRQLIVRVAAVADRFPSVYGDFALVDRGALDAAFNADKPGSAVTNEIWIESPANRSAAVEAALRRPPFDVLAVESQSRLLAELTGDPLARATLLALAGAAVAALALALAGVLLALVADLRDESRELFDLEAEGVEPLTLRRHLRLRAAAVGGFGLAGGVLTGAALSALVVDLVALTASAQAPEPPLLLSVDWATVALALAAYAALAAAAFVVITWAGFRGAAVARPGEALE